MTSPSTDSPEFKDWEECRSSMGRFDAILVDLRKVGFSLITGLLTAGTLVGFLGFSSGANSQPPPVELRAAVFLSIMILIAALFTVDAYYQVLLSAAAERGLDLERQHFPGVVQITEYLCRSATASRGTYVTVLLYVVLVAAAAGLGIYGAGGLGLGLWSAGPGGVLQALVQSGGLAMILGLVIGLVLTLLAFVFGKSQIPRGVTRTTDWSHVIFSCALIALTAALGGVLPNMPSNTKYLVGAWTLAIGLGLALYIELYWVFVTTLTGLHRMEDRDKTTLLLLDQDLPEAAYKQLASVDWATRPHGRYRFDTKSSQWRM